MITPIPPAVMVLRRSKVTPLNRRFVHIQGHLALWY
jgi:hypothetical protein